MDSLGEMGTLFSLADYVFLGGSLVPSGGHNPLEPAGFGLPILTGAHIFKNEAEFDGLAATGAIFEITDARSVADQIMMLEQNPAQRAALAKAAKHYVTMARQRASQAAHCIDRTLKALPVANTPGR
jgi:3-deoxy-D-manno-octulosonic-acid transferase